MLMVWRSCVWAAVSVFLGFIAVPCLAGPQDMVALMQQINTLGNQGRFAEATPLARRLVSEAEKATGQQSLVTAETLVVLAKVLNAQSQTAEAETQLKRALAIRVAAHGPSQPDVAEVLEALGGIELGQNRLADAERDISRAVAIDEAALGVDHLSTALARMPLGNLRHRQLREAEALDQFNRALGAFRKAGGEADVMVPVALNNIAEVDRAQGRLALADAGLAEALALEEKQHGRDSVYVTSTLNNIGELRRAQGRLAEAEALARRALAILEKALGPDHPEVAGSLNNLALVLTRQGRAGEAEALLVRVLAIFEKAFGPDHPNVATALNNLADAQARLGRKDEAEQLFRRSLAIREKSVGPSAPDVALSLANLANLMGDGGRYAEAEPLARRSLAIRQAALGPQHPLVASSLTTLALVVDVAGRHEEAGPLLKQALDIRLHALGETHPDVANSYTNLGSHALALNQLQQAYDAFAAATAILNGRRATEADAEQDKPDLKLHEDANPYPGLIVAAYHLAATDSRQAASLRAHAFEAAQWIGDEETARAIAGMSARVAAGNDQLAARVRQRQDLSQQAIATDKLLIAALSKPDAARNRENEQALRGQASRIASQIKELDGAIAAEFPDYATLVIRAPASIPEVQGELGANEALLLFTTTERFTFVWTLTRAEVRWNAAPLGRKQLADMVGTLRCGLDAEAWLDQGEGGCATKPGLQRPAGAADQLPFDRGQAYALYQALLGPVENDIAGKELILVPSGPLATLPFEVLLTEKPTAGTGAPDLAGAPWLVKRYATTVLPSVASLKALRQLARSSKAPKPFAGFGNPLLEGDPERARLARLLRGCSDLPKSQPQQVAQHGVRSTVALSGMADVEQLRRQMPLPETALELCAVANSFAPTKGEVFLGSDATETKIKALSDSGALAQYRILHFATHGALAGQVRGAIEPGLLLTPPAVATPVDDGYLTSSEISGLRLDADWVVLSACDTAAGEAANAEVFSGLARAFFYAGSRALLVSHWPVRSDAAVAITTGTIDAMVAHPEIGRAEALRRSLVALIAKGGNHAHPSAWAPFVLVGSGSP
jgi:CHAT domain-containing protein/Tfp pilus assembly protein PilF